MTPLIPLENPKKLFTVLATLHHAEVPTLRPIVTELSNRATRGIQKSCMNHLSALEPLNPQTLPETRGSWCRSRLCPLIKRSFSSIHKHERGCWGVWTSLCNKLTISSCGQSRSSASLSIMVEYKGAPKEPGFRKGPCVTGACFVCRGFSSLLTTS